MNAMKPKTSVGARKHSKKAAVRASISFPPEIYEKLELIAKGKKVSLAWVVREASENYIAAAGTKTR